MISLYSCGMRSNLSTMHWIPRREMKTKAYWRSCAMTMEISTANTCAARVEHRRSRRFLVGVLQK
jgi:hypothetical protein